MKYILHIISFLVKVRYLSLNFLIHRGCIILMFTQHKFFVFNIKIDPFSSLKPNFPPQFPPYISIKTLKRIKGEFDAPTTTFLHLHASINILVYIVKSGCFPVELLQMQVMLHAGSNVDPILDQDKSWNGQWRGSCEHGN